MNRQARLKEMRLETSKVDRLANLLGFIPEGESIEALQTQTGVALLDVIDGDYFAAYYKQPEHHHMVCGASVNIDPRTLEEYDMHFRHCDPLHNKMSCHRNPVVASSIMPVNELVATEFYNDFLTRDGLHYGLNMYIYSQDNYIGDVRVWRSRHRDDFRREDADVLRLLKPLLTNAMNQLTMQASRKQAIGLTHREEEVFGLLVQGKSDKEIMRQLDISMSTTRTHVNRVLEKTGSPTRTRLILDFGLRSKLQ